MVHTESKTEPELWKEMEKLPDIEKLKWLKAADEEIKSLRDLQTWTLTELSPGKHAVSCKWIFKVKTDSEGKTGRYKARLVAKGNRRNMAKTMMPLLHQLQGKLLSEHC